MAIWNCIFILLIPVAVLLFTLFLFFSFLAKFCELIIAPPHLLPEYCLSVILVNKLNAQ